MSANSGLKLAKLGKICEIYLRFGEKHEGGLIHFIQAMCPLIFKIDDSIFALLDLRLVVVRGCVPPILHSILYEHILGESRIKLSLCQVNVEVKWASD